MIPAPQNDPSPRALVRVSSSPLTRRQKGSGPDAALGRFGLVLLRAVTPGIAGCQRPPLSYDPGVDVGAVGSGANREDAVVPVHAVACARQFPTADMALQFLRRRLSARPRLPFGVGACLLPFGGIDALQANACPGHFEAVAVEHARATDQR